MIFFIFRTGSEAQEEPHHDIRPTLQRLPFYCTPHAAVDTVILDPSPADLAASKPSTKVLAKVEASQKRKASTYGATSSHVAKCTRSALAQSSDSVDVIPSSRNQGGSSVAPAAEGSNTRDSQGKGIMVDDVVAPSNGVSRPRTSSGPAPSFRDVSGDVIHTNFFLFSAGPYYATYPEGGVAGNCEFTREEWDAPYQPTFWVSTKEIFKDPAVCKTIVMESTVTPASKSLELATNVVPTSSAVAFE
ncbi:hypothetical protein Tco_1542352 [Tanacetum coccineum]